MPRTNATKRGVRAFCASRRTTRSFVPSWPPDPFSGCASSPKMLGTFWPFTPRRKTSRSSAFLIPGRRNRFRNNSSGPLSRMRHTKKIKRVKRVKRIKRSKKARRTRRTIQPRGGDYTIATEPAPISVRMPLTRSAVVTTDGGATQSLQEWLRAQDSRELGADSRP